MKERPLNKFRVENQRRVAARIARNPEAHIPERVLRGAGLSLEHLDDMRDGTWVAPEPEPDVITVRVALAVHEALAPVLKAAETSRAALQAFVDNPTPGRVNAALKASAKVSLAIADLTAPEPLPTRTKRGRRQ